MIRARSPFVCALVAALTFTVVASGHNPPQGSGSSGGGSWSGDDLTVDRVLVGDGTALAPSVAFTSDDDGTGTGLFRSAADTIGFAAGGGTRATLSSTLFTVIPSFYTVGFLQAGNTSAAAAGDIGGTDGTREMLYDASVGSLTFTGTGSLVDLSSLGTATALKLGAGAVGTPAITFGASNAGIVGSGSNVVISAAGQQAALFTASQTTFAANSASLLFIKAYESATGDATLNDVSHSGQFRDNIGVAAGPKTFTLDGTPASGTFWTINQTSGTYELRVDPGSDDKIIWPAHAGLADGEYITSTTAGSTVTLVANSNDDWVVVSATGTWAEETP